MPIQDTVATCSNAMLSENALLILLTGSFVFVVLSLLYLDGHLNLPSTPKKPHQHRPRRPTGAHNCEKAAWRNLLSSNPRD
jgi:hypothetical protein